MLGNTKIAYDETRRAYADELVCAIPYVDALKVYFVSEIDRTRKGILAVRQLTFEGTVLFEMKTPAMALADASTLLAEIPWDRVDMSRKLDSYIKVEFVYGNGCTILNRIFLCDMREYHLLDNTNAGITAKFTGGNGEYWIELHAERFARYVSIKVADVDVLLSDNHLHIDAQETRKVKMTVDYKGDHKESTVIVMAENNTEIILPLTL
jgi:hypothetical protein